MTPTDEQLGELAATRGISIDELRAHYVVEIVEISRRRHERPASITFVSPRRAPEIGPICSRVPK